MLSQEVCCPCCLTCTCSTPNAGRCCNRAAGAQTHCTLKSAYRGLKPRLLPMLSNAWALSVLCRRGTHASLTSSNEESHGLVVHDTDKAVAPGMHSAMSTLTSGELDDLRSPTTGFADLKLVKDQSTKPQVPHGQQHRAATGSQPANMTAEGYGSAVPGAVKQACMPLATQASTQAPSVMPVTRPQVAHGAACSIVREMVTATGSGCADVLGLSAGSRPKGAAKAAWKTK